MRYLDEAQRKQIGFHYILENLILTTPMGVKKKRSAMPYGIKGYEELKKELDYVEEVIDRIGKHKELFEELTELFCRVKEISNSILRLKNGSTLDDIELFEVKYFSKLSDDLKRLYEGLKLEIDYISFHPLERVFAILDPEEKGVMTFHIYEAYSKKLQHIRYEKRQWEEKIVREEDEACKKQLLDKRMETVVAEEEEEQVVRRRISEELKPYADHILHNLSSIGELEFLIAKAQLAVEWGAVKPEVTKGGVLCLEEASNPMVKDILKEKDKEFTRISIEMNTGVTLITGANMGGKSVTINTITLNVFLAQLGFYVFCSKAIVPVFDFVYFISDDMQSVEKGLSTFGAEIIQLKEVVGAARVTKGFIALDELARGTNPKEGKDIVQAVIAFLKEKGSFSLISTHYDGIDMEDTRHYEVNGLKYLDFDKLKKMIDLNRTKSVDILQQHMDYHLEEVQSHEVPKDALNIAALLGLDKEILEIIEKFYTR